ncbi:hypothetical protein ACJVC5_15045 [Peredibacter sp. HCB2-198]|uniref:hypothetical protein n=1 Tax=Peredibacter sp. HCB2-198 TaxID=3383025 RepID=UPI0038B54CE1
MFQNVAVFNDYYLNDNLFYGLEKFKANRINLLNRYTQNLEPNILDIFFLKGSINFQVSRDLFEETRKRPQQYSQFRYFTQSLEKLLNISSDYPDLFADEILSLNTRKNAFGLVKVFLINAMNVESSFLNYFTNSQLPFQMTLSREADLYWIKFNFQEDFFNHILFLSLVDHYELEVLWLQKSTPKIFYDHHAIKVGNFIGEINPKVGIEFNPVNDHKYFSPTKDYAIVESNLHTGEKGSRIFLRALARQKYRSSYNFLSYNCEHFASFCFYGIPRSKQLRFVVTFLIFTLSALCIGQWTLYLSLPFIFPTNLWHRTTYVYRSEKKLNKLLIVMFIVCVLISLALYLLK